MIFGESNIDQVVADLAEFINEFNFNRVGKEQSLGRDVANGVVWAIAERSATEKKGADVDWPANASKYAAWKEKKYGVADAPNTRTGDMLSKRALYGHTTIEPELVTMIYGTGTVPTACAVGGTPGKGDQKTDQEKAYFAHTGQSKKKILRPFYELDEHIAETIQGIIADSLNKYIIEANSRTS